MKPPLSYKFITYQLSKSLNEVINLYERGGFIIHMVLMDMEFEKVAEVLGKLNSTLKYQENKLER